MKVQDGNLSGGRPEQRLIQHFHPVPHWRFRAALQMHDASHIGRDDGMRRAESQVLQLAVAQLPGQGGLGQ